MHGYVNIKSATCINAVVRVILPVSIALNYQVALLLFINKNKNRSVSDTFHMTSQLHRLEPNWDRM